MPRNKARRINGVPLCKRCCENVLNCRLVLKRSRRACRLSRSGRTRGLSAGVAGRSPPAPSADGEMPPSVVSSAVCRGPLRVPSGRVARQRPCQVKAALGGVKVGWGALAWP